VAGEQEARRNHTHTAGFACHQWRAWDVSPPWGRGFEEPDAAVAPVPKSSKERTGVRCCCCCCCLHQHRRKEKNKHPKEYLGEAKEGRRCTPQQAHAGGDYFFVFPFLPHPSQDYSLSHLCLPFLLLIAGVSLLPLNAMSLLSSFFTKLHLASLPK